MPTVYKCHIMLHPKLPQSQKSFASESRAVSYCFVVQQVPQMKYWLLRAESNAKATLLAVTGWPRKCNWALLPLALVLRNDSGTLSTKRMLSATCSSAQHTLWKRQLSRYLHVAVQVTAIPITRKTQHHRHYFKNICSTLLFILL